MKGSSSFFLPSLFSPSLPLFFFSSFHALSTSLPAVLPMYNIYCSICGAILGQISDDDDHDDDDGVRMWVRSGGSARAAARNEVRSCLQGRVHGSPGRCVPDGAELWGHGGAGQPGHV